EAYSYYDSLSYVNYVEYDVECENSLYSIDSENINLQNTYTKNDFDFIPDCPSTVNQNIDDAIKLLKRENIEMPEIRVGVIDSGISKTKITEDVLEDGYSFLEGYSENGTDDRYGHGTKVAGTIIINSIDNIKLLPFQVYDSSGCSNLSNVVTAIYLGVSENCKILNCSIGIKTAVSSTKNAFEEAVNYAVSQGCICVASAGNDNINLSETNQLPASVKNSIAVGAITQKKKITSFSNFGDGVDIYAIGSNMLSYDNNGTKVTNWLGTSAATPVISSICALLITAKPDITVDEIKQLLIETGYSFNEENQSDKDRIIADAYGCVKKLLGKELEQVDLDYTITKDETTGCSDISFSSNDKNVRIYYELGLGSLSEIPYKEMTGASQYEYKLGKTIKLSKWQKITVAAYAPGKEKKVLCFSAPTYNNEGGYRLTQSSKTQQYNMVDRCQFIDEKVIEVPETINGIEIQEIGDWCFIGNKTVEKIILPETVKQIDYYAFANCPNLKEVIAPGVETCGMYAFSNCNNLVNVEMPNVTVANTGMFKNCTSLETAKLGTLTEIDNHAFYGCENLKLVKTTNDNISFAINTLKNCNNLTIYTPKDSSMEIYALENDIPLLGDVQDNGGSIRVTDAGLRFGYQYNGEENENIEEYGFVYNSGKTNDLTVDNALRLVANNRINHGDHTTYNLVFTDVAYTDKAFNQMISAKAYIKIGGEYFYSNVVQHSYNTIADAVLKDETIDSNTKNAVENILDKVA
ncbi:MAG: S8 family serine peptidase, partial [Eubacterium sp.]|nr:S8 family serine peptidase [Eubacterium sp.]